MHYITNDNQTNEPITENLQDELVDIDIIIETEPTTLEAEGLEKIIKDITKDEDIQKDVEACMKDLLNNVEDEVKKNFFANVPQIKVSGSYQSEKEQVNLVKNIPIIRERLFQQEKSATVKIEKTVASSIVLIK